MRTEVVVLALAVGALTWAFRALPLRMSLHAVRPDTRLGRFLAATGPAAIGTLFVAAVLPYVRGDSGEAVPLVAGVAAVLGLYFWRRSVVLATLGGAVFYGIAQFLTGV